jgi:hypothetical protein
LGVWGFIPSHFPSLPGFFLAYNLANLCLGHEPKLRVATPLFHLFSLVHLNFNEIFQVEFF